MPEWSRPALLALLVVVALVRRLHRRHEARTQRTVPALFLWPATAADASAGSRGARLDPRWRLRAVVAALLAVAAAGLALVGRDGPSLDVLVDDGPSLAAREAAGTRRDRAVDALVGALEAARPGAIRLVSLSRPGRTLVLDPGAPAGWHAAIAGWLAPAERTARLPAPAAGRERWLVTDGADAAVRAWAATVGLHRVLPVGEATENVALTRLAARPSLVDPARHRALVRVTNGGTRAATRRLVVGGEPPLLDVTLTVPPGEAMVRAFDVPADVAVLRARLEAPDPRGTPDALAADDALELTLGPLARARVRVASSCGPHLARALAAHPALVRAADGVDLLVGCDAAPPVGAPALWIHAAAERAGDPEPVRETPGPPRLVEARLDLEAPARVGRPEYAALVNDLVERALGRPLLERVANADRPEAAAAVAPHAVGGGAALPPSSGSGARRETAPLLLALAAALLLADVARRGVTPRRAVARVALAVTALAAAWGPTVPGGRAPLDAIVVLDDSASVDRDVADDAWRRAGSALAGLPGAGRLTVLRFAAEPVVEVEDVPLAAATPLLAGEPPRRLALDRGRTDVARALDAALGRPVAGRRAAVVLATDGLETDGDAAAALVALGAAGVPVVAIPLASPAVAGDAWIAAVEAPGRARVGDVVPIGVTVAAADAGDAVVELAVDEAPRATRRVALGPGGGVHIDFALGVGVAGPRRVRITVTRPGDPRPGNDTRELLVDVAGPPAVLYVAGAAPGPLAGSLARGGWAVETVPPVALATRLAAGPPPAVVVLDDVAVDDAPAAGWEALDAGVRRDGTGLLVLGGSRAFAAGDYRDSVLEGLLPVTAEGRARGAGAAVLFLVDTSGSMERDRAGRRRLALAWRAVAAAARAVPAGDLVGVTTFALEPAPLVPLGPAATAVARLAGELPAASGGTRLAPALEHARLALAGAPADERWLVVVTDGFVGDEDIAPAAGALAADGVRVIALAIGTDVDVAALERLTAGGGRLLRTDDAAALPRLVGRTVGTRGGGVREGEAVPRVAAALPFGLEVDRWPAVSAYAVTAPRDGAVVPLATDEGEPLLAMHHAGAGRVAVLPAGLGGWAAGWSRWPGWAGFAGGLMGWLAGAAGEPRLDVRAADVPAGLAITVEAVGRDGEWLTPHATMSRGDAVEATDARAVVTPPGGHARAVPLVGVAPGRFVATLPAATPGLHRVAVTAGDATAARWALRTTDREQEPAQRDAVATWRDAGLLAVWPRTGVPEALVPARAAVPLRPWLALATLAAWVALLARELGGRIRAGRERPARAA